MVSKAAGKPTRNQKTGLRLTNEIGLKVDWLELTRNLYKCISGGFKAYVGDIKSGADAVFALIDAARAVKQDIPVGSKALELLVLCFAWSFDSIRASGHLQEDEAKNAAKRAISSLKARVDAGDIKIPYDFFDQPQAAEPYRILRDEFIESRGSYRPTKNENEAKLRARFDSSFRSAVWEVWASRVGAFEELARILSSPAAKSADVERQWQAYRESLVHEFEVVPVFGQEATSVALGQLYVPLRCFWRESDAPESSAFRYGNEEIRRDQIIHARDLQAELDDWLESDNVHDWLRLIGGGPGSGKSTSAKAFAAQLARRPEVRPLYVPLQRLADAGSLRERINNYFRNRSGCSFQIGPLDRQYVEYGPRLALIFDGLDEIARPGESADDVARDMIDWIRDLHTELTGETSVRHCVVITGRMPSFQAARRGVGSMGKEALEVLSFRPVIENGQESEISIFGPMVKVEGNSKLTHADQRPDWWDAYRIALDRPPKPPHSLSDERLEGLTAEPLLCYLLALSGYLEKNSKLAADNRNRVYEQLLHDVWERAWGGGRAGPGNDLSKEEFDKLFEAMALAAWHGGDARVATEERFEKAIKLLNVEKEFAAFKNQSGENLSNLAVNFYLKRPDIQSRGFEFTHKSFGEYLIARALIRSAVSVGKLSWDRIDIAMGDWLGIVADGYLSFELLEFLIDEARLLDHTIASETLRALERMMDYVIENGLPAHELRCESWREAETRHRNSETLLMSLLHSMSNAVSYKDEKAARIKIDWSGQDNSLGRLLDRLRYSSDIEGPIYYFGNVGLRLFSNIEAPNAILSIKELNGSKFNGANLESSRLFGAHLVMADMSGSNLNGADCRHVFGAFCNFENADMKGVSFENSDLSNARFIGANLEMAIFDDANLEDADFSNANLKGAKFHNAIIADTHFDGANMEDVEFDD
jgi:hypothetical protein